MDSYNILKSKCESKSSVDKDILLDVDISSDGKIFPIDNIENHIDQYRRFIYENDTSNKYRFVFTINPLCSNVLFNRATEVMSDEGSKECKVYYGKIKYNNLLDRNGLIKNTTYSHPNIGGLIYHCGCDIFNNHMFRGKEFSIVCKESGDTKHNYFNTIDDYVREYNGEIVKDEDDKGIKLYNIDNTYSFDEAISKKLIERDGWFGFINPCGLEIKNYGEYIVNKCLNNNKACEFIDLYPDRSLFSFNPKINRKRGYREENNWDYCITYPFENYTDNKLVSLKDSNGKEVVNGILTDFHDEIVFNENNNEPQLKGDENNEFANITLYTRISNNLISSDTIKITLVCENGNNETIVKEVYDDVKLVGVGLNGYYLNYYFTIKLMDISSELKTLKLRCGDFEPKNLRCYISRIAEFRPCKYYFRKFRRIPNFKNTKVNVDNGLTEQDINENVLNGFDSTLNKLGFSTNIYGDRMSQIVFQDDVVTSGLRDNLGRELHEVFLTIVKRNRGYKEWKNGEYGDENVEFSHCFGEVTSGIDMPWEDDSDNNQYNVHKIHNINKELIGNTDFKKIIPDSLEVLEEDITIEGAKDDNRNGVFLGDIVELDELNVEEHVLEVVQHRFNTTQREDINDYYNIAIDEFTGETATTTSKVNLFDSKGYSSKVSRIYIQEDNTYRDYVGGSTSGSGTSSGKGSSSNNRFPLISDLDDKIIVDKPIYYFSDNNGNNGDNNTVKVLSGDANYYANLAPEGYYYKPHYQILIKEFSEIVNEGQDTIVVIEEFIENNDNVIKCKTDKNYFFEIGNNIIFYDKNDGSVKYVGKIVNVEGKDFSTISFIFDNEIEIESISDIEKFNIFKPNLSKPSSAYEFDDGSGIYRWREFKSCEEITSDSELYDIPFTNGAHYHHKKINFFLRRQDPMCIYGLNHACNEESNYITDKISLFDVYGGDRDISFAEFLDSAEVKIC